MAGSASSDTDTLRGSRRMAYPADASDPELHEVTVAGEAQKVFEGGMYHGAAVVKEGGAVIHYGSKHSTTEAAQGQKSSLHIFGSDGHTDDAPARKGTTVAEYMTPFPEDDQFPLYVLPNDTSVT